ncbi:Outer membrane porin protein 32 [Paraburkholderia caffeinitolerans]|uniref:Outer membrane porin protein 32 n=1 Tax=Paraburkholderia caffeinitolerans TaxID=1723730 RepID=A0A6J5GBQ8_9BURK|nr:MULTISPECIES: porin [Paraburkholderia]CAB3795664.1 Outer membrane porin protein 32 [Paraburkholderia caffeinitolerans]
MRIVGKSICGATLALLAGTAAAQSSVTLYGVADVFLQYMDNGGQHAYSERSGGNTGSMFGLKGSEELGNGLKAIFDVETGFNVNNGTLFANTSSIFYRQAWVGLTNDRYGTLTFGRVYQPTFWIVYPTDPFRGNEILSPLSAGVLAVDRNTLATQYVTGRTSNAILYKSPNISGFQAYAMYGFAATVTQPVPQTSGNTLDLAASYSGYGLYAGIAYQYQHPGTETLPGLPAALNLLGTEHYTGAIGYRFGIVNLTFNYAYNKPHDASSRSLAALLGADHSNSLMELGATIQATAADAIEIAGVERNVRGAHDNTVGVEVGVDHNLSKRTALYMRAGYMKNNGSATMTWPGVTANGANATQVLVALGMTHRF